MGLRFGGRPKRGCSSPVHSMSRHPWIQVRARGPGEDAGFGFTVLGTWEIEQIGSDGYVDPIREHVGDLPLYLSLDIDVLDPAFAPATGTPEVGGFSTRELMGILRGLRGLQPHRR